MTVQTLPDALPRPSSPVPELPATGAGHQSLFASWVPAAAALVLTLAVHLPHLGWAPLAGTEGHRALTADQMVRSGHWLLPTLYGRLYLAKPPLHYWFIAIAQTVAGVGGEYVWRVPSAVAAALLNAALAWFAGRWFGRAGGLAAGGLAVGLIPLWAQQQSADIDASNTLFACLAALCWVELLFRAPRRPWWWATAAGLALGASFLVKGPAGLPVALAVPLAKAWLTWRGRRAARLSAGSAEGSGGMVGPADGVAWPPAPSMSAAAAVLVSLAIGLALFGLYAAAAALEIRSRGLAPDWRGMREGGRNLAPGSVGRFAQALAIGPLLFAFGLPTSLAVLGPLVRRVRECAPPAHRPMRAALATSVVCSWALCTLSGMVNPRYGYVTLPPLCVLAGGMIVDLARRADTAAAARAAATVAAGGLAGATAVVAVLAVRSAHADRTAVAVVGAVCGVTAAAVGVTAVVRLRRGGGLSAAAAMVVVALLCFSVPFSLWRADARWRASGLVGAAALRSAVGPGGHVETGLALTFQPEVFHYAGADAMAHPVDRFGPADVGHPTWVLLTAGELKRWEREAGDRLSRRAAIPANGGNRNHLAWYAGPRP